MAPRREKAAKIAAPRGEKAAKIPAAPRLIDVSHLMFCFPSDMIEKKDVKNKTRGKVQKERNTNQKDEHKGKEKKP